MALPDIHQPGIAGHPSTSALPDIHQQALRTLPDIHQQGIAGRHYRTSINCIGITLHPSTNARSSIGLLKLVDWMI
jgi:hypothetical protein